MINGLKTFHQFYQYEIVNKLSIFYYKQDTRLWLRIILGKQVNYGIFMNVSPQIYKTPAKSLPCHLVEVNQLLPPTQHLVCISNIVLRVYVMLFKELRILQPVSVIRKGKNQYHTKDNFSRSTFSFLLMNGELIEMIDIHKMVRCVEIDVL